MHQRVVRAVAVSMLLAGVSRAQAPSPAPSAAATTGFMHAIHATNVVEKTLAFYTEVFGLSGQVQPFANQAVPILTDSPGVTLKVSMLRLPGEGFNFELTEFSNVARTPAQPEIWDPGAPHMKILVRDIEPVVAAVRKLGAPIITTSGAPVSVRTPIGHVKAIMFRDPDGYIDQGHGGAGRRPTREPATSSAPIMGLTVEDMDTAMKFWRDMLGFELAGNRAFSADPALAGCHGHPEGRIVPRGAGRGARQHGPHRDDRVQGHAAEAVLAARAGSRFVGNGDPRCGDRRSARAHEGQRRACRSRGTASS